jgi:hypothetical protein
VERLRVDEDGSDRRLSLHYIGFLRSRCLSLNARLLHDCAFAIAVLSFILSLLQGKCRLFRGLESDVSYIRFIFVGMCMSL